MHRGNNDWCWPNNPSRSGSLAVALGPELKDARVVDEAIDGGHGHDLVSEDGSPISKRAIAGDDQAAVFVTFGDQFEKDAGFGLVFAHISEVVED